MTELVSKYWWVFVLRGVAALVFGLLAFAQPGITIATLVLFFGAYALVDGVFSVVAAVGGRGHGEHGVLLLLEGLLGIAVGILTWRAPAVTELALIVYVAAWALVTGALEVVAAVRLRKEIEGEFWLGLGGLLSMLLGLAILWNPGAGALGLAWLVGTYAVAFGVALIMLGFGARRARAAAGTA